MPLRQRFDHLLLVAAILQTGIGMAVLASASWLLATERYHRPGSYFVTWQAATAVIGLGLMVMVMHLRLKLVTTSRVATAAVAISWLMLVGALLQPTVASTHRWLQFGSVSLQPSVVARLAVILWVAVQLDAARQEGWPGRRLALVGAVSAVTVGLIAVAPDLGSAALVVLVLAAMAFVADMPIRLLGPPAVVGGAGLGIAVATVPYCRERIFAFLHPDAGSPAAWQSYQSLVAMGSGGIAGKGYGLSLQKLFFLPEPHTDFVLSITGEELGLIGVLALITLPATITWRGLRIALGQVQPRRALLAFGVTLVYALQSLVHMAVCLKLLPPKGIPLPLVSYGKTDLLVTLATVGLLLNLSRETGR